MPPNVSKNKYSYYIKTQSNRSITLCKITSTHAEVWAAYEKALADEKDKVLFKDLWGKFLASMDFSDLAPRSQKDYLSAQKSILGVFGETEPGKIKPEHIRNYMDLRGERSRVQANHEHSCMSRVFRWGYERGLVTVNPCSGVRKFPKPQRQRYITDEEYSAIYENADPVVRIGMEIAYLCAARLSDVLGMRWLQVMDAGIFIQQGKTGTKQIKAWTPRLRRAIDLARETAGDSFPSSPVLRSKSGGGYSKRGFSHRWEEARAKASAKLGRPLDCTFHDLKAKGISDYEGSSRDKQLFSGHKTEGQVTVYDRKTKISPTLDIE